ncbi:hypothetical protein SAMN05421818_11923 [Myroides phaeus]|uniref:Lipoprotein n=1 Tax=Myroides phaeus TaxID=702745 RepID=A0A1G8FTQ8_9FLAO|nr:hypothetical protein [Myroides phaeus]MEC4116444.1 hypothetical protein [Myroides phaeus]SDH85512.1 hypothetical protein SAMN05421818_11923 [Myroides phaeus]
MKNTFLFLATLALITSCSSSDDNSPLDPISSQPYNPLTSLTELEDGKYQYVGNDIGNGKVGIVNPTSGTCKENDLLVVYKTDQKLDSITYANYKTVIGKKNEIKCEKIGGEYDRVLRNNRLNATGVLSTQMTEDAKIPLTEEEKKENPGKEFKIERNLIYKGTVEIGKQGGYLRIEDHLSGYKPGSQIKGKPYLYFKKINE